MKRYSKNAMPQLARMTSQSGELLNFGLRLPYHANVMKMFESVSSTTGSQRDEVISMSEKMNSSASVVKCECASFQSRSDRRRARSFNCEFNYRLINLRVARHT